MNPEAAGYVTVTKDRRCQVWARTNRVSCVLLFVCACALLSLLEHFCVQLFATTKV